MKILVLTGFDQKLLYGPIGENSWRTYAKRHQYDFVCCRKYPEDLGYPAWQKLRVILENMGSHDWIFWTDIDSVVTNADVKLEDLIDPTCMMVVSKDWGPSHLSPWSSGHMLLHDGEETKLFLREAQKFEEYKNESAWDQSAMQHLCATDRQWEGRIKILKARVMNSVPRDAAPAEEPWEPGDFLVHITGWVTQEGKIPLMGKYEVLSTGKEGQPS